MTRPVDEQHDLMSDDGFDFDANVIDAILEDAFEDKIPVREVEK